MNRKTIAIHLAIVTLTGIGICIAGWFLFPRIPVLSDALEYFTVARNLLTGKGLVSSYCTSTSAYLMGIPHPDHHLPGWSSLIAAFMAIIPLGPHSPIVLGMFLLVASAFLSYFLLLIWSDERRALMGALLFYAFPGISPYAFTGMAENALVFWIILSLFLTSLPWRRLRALAFVCIGFSLWAAYLTRETAILFFPLLILIMKERGFSWISITLFALMITALCFASNYFYFSYRPGFREAMMILRRYDAFACSGLWSENRYPLIKIVRWEDFPGAPAHEILFGILVRKPILIMPLIVKSGFAKIFHRLLLLAPLLLSPVVARGKIRLGLILSLAVLPLLFTLYHGHELSAFIRMLLVFSVVHFLFIVVFVRTKGWLIWAGNLVLTVGGLFMALGIKNLYTDAERKSRALQAVYSESLPHRTLYMAWGLPGHYEPLHLLCRSEDLTIVFWYLSVSDILSLKQRTGLNAVLSMEKFSELVEMGWIEKLTISNRDTFWLYLEPVENKDIPMRAPSGDERPSAESDTPFGL